MVRSTDRLAWLLGSCVFAVACGASEEAPSVFDPSTPSPSGGPATLPDGLDGPIPGFGQVGDGLGLGGAIKVEGLRIEPENAVLEVVSGQRSSLAFKVYGRVNGATSERELTARAAFYVPDNHLVGSFPSNGSNTFQSRLPASLTEPAQRGGVVTVQAQVANSDGTLATVKTNLTVRLSSDLRTSNGGASVPSSPETRFGGSAKPSRAPRIVYPNDGVLLPPNLRRLEVHWDPGSVANQLFEVAFNSALGKIRYYTRCGAGSAAFKAGSCALELDEQGYAFLAETNRGGGPVTLTVRGASDTGGEFGESAPTRLTFAETDVAGGIYYWTVSKPPRIMRFDFGGQAKAPEEFLRPSTNGLSESCVGCHTLSRDGSKLIASVGGQKDGRLVFLRDLTKPVGSAGWLTQGGTSIAAAQNRIQFASFNPTGSELVATYGDDAALGSPFKPADLDPRKLWFLDGNTGLRKGSLALPFKPDHPEWSPNGAMIAMTRVGNETATAQRPTRGGLEMLKATGNGWGPAQTLVPIQPGYNRYNPNFVPDSSFLLYSESVCPTADWDGPDCDADSDSSAKTWAMASTPGSPRVLLAKAAAGGVADGGRKDLADTFPRSTPFQSKQGSGKLFWFTVASRREPGLRAKTDDNQQLLWMFAVDPAAILAGKDGSYPGFYLPFQDLKTSNHIAQWTQKIVSDNPPPPPAPTPPPPPPPVPTR